MKAGGGGSEEAPLSSVTSAAAAAAGAAAAAATTPPQPRRATPGPARRRRRRRVSTSPSCCCCCRCCRCVPRCRRCPRYRRCLLASPRVALGRRCRSSRSRTDDGYSLADRAAATTAARAAGPAPAAAPQGALRGAARAAVATPSVPLIGLRRLAAVGPAHNAYGALTHCPGRLPCSASSWFAPLGIGGDGRRVHVTGAGWGKRHDERGRGKRPPTLRPAHPHLGLS